jgi:hypothetical protein
MMLKFTYVTGTDVWITSQHIVSIRDGLNDDERKISLIRTVDGEQFAVKGDPAEIVTYFDEVEVDA